MWLALVAILLAAGCGEPCTEGDPGHCDGNTVVYCANSGDLDRKVRWFRRDCGAATCMLASTDCTGFVSSQEAVCGDSPQPIPECAGKNCSNICWNGKLTRCVDGYPTATQSCAKGCDPVNGWCNWE